MSPRGGEGLHPPGLGADARTHAEGQMLAAKIREAALDVETVDKRGVNDFHGYSYATAEDIAAAATKALLAKGVLAEFEADRVDLQPAAKGMIATIHGKLRITDTETGHMVARLAVGAGQDNPGDKAVYKAMTGARKYAFIHLLGIPIGDDPEDGPGRTRRQTLEAPKLEPDRIAAITKAIRAKGLTLREVDELLGAAGIDGLRARSKKAVLERLESLDAEQADALEAELEGGS